MKVLFYVQHLLGVGHVFRAARIARALCAQGMSVDLVHGGEPVPNADAGGSTVHQLPPLRAGRDEFHLLETPSGSVADDAYRDRRRNQLLAHFADCKPDAVVIEAFPFGRRQMRFELLPLLEEAANAKQKPAIVCSVRDILQERTKPGRNEETVAHIESYFDHVMVHGDPHMVKLDETFPLAAAFAGKTVYTGIVAPDPTEAVAAGNGEEVIVSVGGGMLGRQLLEAAAAARRISSLSTARWLFATGPSATPEMRGRIAEMAGEGSTVVPFIGNLTGRMAQAQLSISRCGYNTVADLFVSGCRAIVAPLDDGNETEQLKRAEILEKKGLATVLWPQEVLPEILAAKIDATVAAPPPDRNGISLDGAERSAGFIRGWLNERAAK